MSVGRWVLAVATLGALVVASLLVGAADLRFGDVLAALLGGGDGTTGKIVRDLRLPRALLGLLVGAGLAMSGVTMQSTLRNPLAEPYLLGVSGGAAVGAVLATTLGASGVGLISLGAFGGALAAVAAVLLLARGAGGGAGRDPRVLVTAGVVAGAFANAVIMIALAAAPPTAQRSALWWMMGSVAAATWPDVLWLGSMVLATGALTVHWARQLDVVALGPDAAASLGVDPRRATTRFFIAGSLLAAGTVATAGLVGFVGLIVPHLVRAAGARAARLTLLSAALGGASLVLVADIIARTVRAPIELPLGAVTAVLGVPFFVWRLRQGGTER
jgi:iron complex transport system permease protein